MECIFGQKPPLTHRSISHLWDRERSTKYELIFSKFPDKLLYKVLNWLLIFKRKENFQLQLSERLKFPHVCSEVHRYSSWVAGRLRTIVRYEQSKHWMKLVMGRIRNEIGKLSQLWTSFVKKEIAILNNNLGLLTLQNRRKSVN